jgi:hypothetical protein
LPAASAASGAALPAAAAAAPAAPAESSSAGSVSPLAAASSDSEGCQVSLAEDRQGQATAPAAAAEAAAEAAEAIAPAAAAPAEAPAALAQPQRGAWLFEINPEHVLIGERLAMGGFAEVFVGRYQVGWVGFVGARVSGVCSRAWQAGWWQPALGYPEQWCFPSAACPCTSLPACIGAQSSQACPGLPRLLADQSTCPSPASDSDSDSASFPSPACAQGTTVAIKVLLSVDPRGQQRFAAEVRVLASLRHPNVVGSSWAAPATPTWPLYRSLCTGGASSSC